MAQDFNYVESRPQQYNNSKTINALLSGLDDRIRIKYPELLSKVYNLDTAEGANLDVLAARVGASRYVNFPINVFSERFGFDNNDWYGFDQYGGTFDNFGDEIEGHTLNDEALRTYIRFKAVENISVCSLGDLNKALQQLFPGRGICYAKAENDLELTLVFNFYLEPYEKGLIINRYFPVPAGYTLRLEINY